MSNTSIISSLLIERQLYFLNIHFKLGSAEHCAFQIDPQAQLKDLLLKFSTLFNIDANSTKTSLFMVQIYMDISISLDTRRDPIEACFVLSGPRPKIKDKTTI